MLLYHQYAKSLDSIVTVLARWLRKIKNDAAEALQEIKNSNQKITDQLIDRLKQVLIASKQTAQTPEEKLVLIEQSLPHDIDASIEACEQYLAYADDNDLPLFRVVFMRPFTFSMGFMKVMKPYVQIQSMGIHMRKTKWYLGLLICWQ